MLEKEHKHLMDNLISLQSNIEEIYNILNTVLSAPEKDYSICINNKKFEIFNPWTISEKKLVDKNRKEIIKFLLEKCIVKSLRKLPYLPEDRDFFCSNFSPLIAFMYGENPQDHKFEKAGLQQLYEVEDCVFGKARPLNEESYQVKTNLEEKVI